MIVFTPTSMGEVGDTAKNDYFESWAAGLADGSGCFASSASISSIVGSVPLSCSGSFSRCLNSEMPRGFAMSRSAYSATIPFFALQRIRPFRTPARVRIARP